MYEYNSITLNNTMAKGFSQMTPPTRTITVALDMSKFQRQQYTSGRTVRSSDLQIVVISSLQTVSSTVFRFRVKFAAAKLTHYSTTPHRLSTTRNLDNASCSQVMCTKILALLPSIHVPCVQATSQVVG